jgi:hypothetical protein
MPHLDHMRMPSADILVNLTTLTRSQDGVITRTQLFGWGASDEMIENQLRARRWQRIHRGVYATFTGPLPFATQVGAALLRVGPEAVASHETAAYLDGLVDEPGDVIHITAPASRRIRGQLSGLTVHYAERLPISRHPARTPPRTRIEDTVLDLIGRAASVEDVATWVTRLCQRRLSTPDRLAACLVRRKKIRWRREIEAMVASVAEGAQSPLEVRYLRYVERPHGVPSGERNQRWAGRRVIWIDINVSRYQTRIELDGRIGHVEEGAFRDRRRDNAATVSGHGTLRYGYGDIFGDPCGVAAEVATVLNSRGWRGTLRRCGRSCAVPSHSP